MVRFRDACDVGDTADKRKSADGAPLRFKARAVRFDRSGHAPHLEQPELFNRTLRDFADRLSRGRATQEKQI